jgi:hypothetical protein
MVDRAEPSAPPAQLLGNGRLAHAKLRGAPIARDTEGTGAFSAR